MQGKKDTKRLFVVLLVFSGLLGGVGQFFFKEGLSSAAGLIPFLILGILAYGASTLAYFYALGRSHLSWAYGFIGLSYITAALLASFVLGEPITPLRWAGIFVIVIGTAVIGSS
jgi:drug/metabolite transporter (DMT)-like permease